MNNHEYRILYSEGEKSRFYIVGRSIYASSFIDALTEWARKFPSSNRSETARYLVQDKATLDARLYRPTASYDEI